MTFSGAPSNRDDVVKEVFTETQWSRYQRVPTAPTLPEAARRSQAGGRAHPRASEQHSG